ncbi:restriction endonuclease subunit S [Clostridiales bacterium COT073_COT-073]|nr:restriction endonuclease subunit S [Clostridiales bacterium COT073_COT-073]
MREMKDSGIEWIGEIPKEWKIIHTKRLFNNKKEVAGEEVFHFQRLALTLKGVVKRSKDDNEGLQPEKFESYQILRKNELVFKLIDLENIKTSRVGLSRYEGLVSPAYIVLSNNFNDNRYYYYWFISMYYNCVFNILGGQGVRSSLNARELLALPIVLNSKPEQQKIANYLDDKCSKIDKIIEKEQVIIEKLKEYKQSLITEAVTKGLDTDVEMKDSGVEWIGEIPESWRVTTCGKVIISTQNGLSRRDLEKSEGTVVLKLKNITQDGKIDYSSVNKIMLTEDEIRKYKLQERDLLFVRVNGSKNLVGKCAIYNSNKDIVAYNDHIIRVKINNDLLDVNFLLLYLNSVAGRTEIELKTITAAGQYTINGEGLKSMNVCVPDCKMQKLIVSFLYKKCIEIDKAILNKESLIEKLTEYKKSLIYEVVTGKKEV